MMRRFTILCCLFFIMSCKSTNSGKVKAIIGQNDLVLSKNADERLGLLITDARQCNASLISKSEVATALHCASPDPNSFVGFYFLSANGQKANVSDITMLDDKKDFVVYKLDQSFPKHFEFGALDNKKPLTLLAIDIQKNRQVTTSCSVSYQLQGAAAFAHQCDTIPKFSGAPILQDEKIVGIHVGTNLNETMNFALNTRQLHDDAVDISVLDQSIKLEWPHARSQHVRTPHLRTDQILVPLPIGVTGYPMWADRAGACGTGFTSYLVPDNWGLPGLVANFTPACQAHDQCYSQQLGREKCDKDLREDIRKICESTFNNDLFIVTRGECIAVVSNVYYEAVKNAGVDAYNSCSNGKC